MTTTTSTATTCPQCSNKGKRVKSITLRSLVKDEVVGDVVDVEYKFCNATGCDVVYFSDGQTFTKDQLKVPVGAKETTGERPLCYCFGHSVATLTKELETKGRSDALDDIRQKMKDPGCHCETANPSGSCCLGSVSKGIAIAKSELDQPASKPSSNRVESITKVGTVLSAVMASSCCWLPLLLILFGVSGAGVAGVLESYRPLFITLTVGFLGAAFYFTYRPKRTADGGDCGTDDCCSPTTKDRRRFNMVTMNKIMLWVVTVLAVTFMLFPNYVGLILAGRDSDVITTDNSLIRTTTVRIEGMHCEGCTAIAKQSIKQVPGVLQVKVDYTNKRAVIATESCCEFPKEAILTAIEDAGYTGHILEDQRLDEAKDHSGANTDATLNDLSEDSHESSRKLSTPPKGKCVVMHVSPEFPMCQDGASVVQNETFTKNNSEGLPILAQLVHW